MLHMFVSRSAQSGSSIRVWFLRLKAVHKVQPFNVHRSHLMCARALLHILEHHLLAFSHLTSICIIGSISLYRMFLNEAGAEALKKIKSVSYAYLENGHLEKVWKGLWKRLARWCMKKS